jgi:hypothetical protein
VSAPISAPEMALSIRQPWAELIVMGAKTIENRVWNTHKRGPFFVHASAGCTREEYASALVYARSIDPGIRLPTYADLLRGGFVGRVDIVDVVPACSDPNDRTAPGGFTRCTCGRAWHMGGGQFGIVLANAQRVPFIPFRGSQRWFRVPDRIRVQLEPTTSARAARSR